MKVNNNIGSKISSTAADSAAALKSSSTDKAKQSKTATDAFSALASESARVDLSDKAKDVKKAKEIAKKGFNEVDEAKVSRLQSLIDSGKYQIDSAKIADRMVDEHLSNELAAGEEN